MYVAVYQSLQRSQKWKLTPSKRRNCVIDVLVSRRELRRFLVSRIPRFAGRLRFSVRSVPTEVCEQPNSNLYSCVLPCDLLVNYFFHAAPRTTVA
jgi:hypothetical protein